MPILIRDGSKSVLVSPKEFSNEDELETALKDFPALLLDDGPDDGAAGIKFVARQVNLPEGGRLDLLFVDSEGVPIVVETKLGDSVEARRVVVAQAIDYLSSLTLLTVDELDKKVNGKLDLALRALVSGGDESSFDALWQKVGENLRDGRARMVVAVDEAPPDLQRIFRFLARRSNLDIRLVSVQRYVSSSAGEILVPQILVSRELADGRGRIALSKEPYPELVAAFEAYNASAPDDLRAAGEASNYRYIRPVDWPTPHLASYSFRCGPGRIGVQLGVRPAASEDLEAVVSSFAREPVAGGQAQLQWSPMLVDKNKGRLFAEFPLETSAATIAQAMRDLISATRTKVGERIKLVANQKAHGAV
jgi:hypothetical protein